MDDTTLPITILGTPCRVPAGRTLLNALRGAGHDHLRGCGCRVGACGECAVSFRRLGDPILYSEFACIVPVEAGMTILSLPFAWALAYRRAQASVGAAENR